PLTAPAPAAIYTLSLHDALPISPPRRRVRRLGPRSSRRGVARWAPPTARGGGRQRAAPPRRTCPSAPPPSAQRTAPGSDTARGRSEEHTSELQSRGHLVCRLLLE